MFRPVRILRNLDPRAFPIAVKISLALSFVLLVSLIIADIVISQVVFDSQTELALGDLNDFSRAQGFRVLGLLEQETTILNQLSALPVVQNKLRQHNSGDAFQPDSVLYDPDIELQALLGQIRRSQPEFDSLVIVDVHGHILAADPAPAQLDEMSDPTWTWYTGAYRNGGGATFINNPFDDRLTGIRGIHIAIPVFSEQSSNNVIGVAYGIWNLSNARELVLTGSGREGLILERDGTVLLSPNQDELGTVVSGRLLTSINGPAGNAFPFVDDEGRRFLYGAAQLPELGISDPTVTGLGWVMLVRSPSNVVDANVLLLQSRLRLVLGIVGGLVTLMVLFFSRALMRPLRRLTDVAVRIERGDLSAKIPQFPPDEIGKLSAVLSVVVQQLVARVQSLNSTVEISRKTAQTLDIAQMLADVVGVLGREFNYPDARIYLVEPGSRSLRLQAAAGGEGERLLRVGHRLELNETSLVGRAILLNEPVLGGTHDQLRRAGLVAENTELAVPLQAAGQTLGAIEVVSHKLQQFTVEEIGVLRLIADQVSSSIQNARLFEQSAANVREIEALNRRLTRQVWEDYVSDAGAIRHTLDPKQEWPDTLADVRQRVEIKAETYADESGRSVLAAPLILRGEAVGTLAVTRPGGETWTRDEVMLLEAIASRMAIIAESIRLVDESTQRAEREQRVNEISANLLQRATSVETVLRSALGELGGALGSDRISLRIGQVPVRDDHRIGTGPLGDTPSIPEDNGHDGADSPEADNNRSQNEEREA